MRAVPRLCEVYPGICLTTEEKARKNLSQGKEQNMCKSPSTEFPNKGSDSNKRGPLLVTPGSLQRLTRRNSTNHKDVGLLLIGSDVHNRPTEVSDHSHSTLGMRPTTQAVYYNVTILEFRPRVFAKYSNVTKIPPVEAELLHENGRTPQKYEEANSCFPQFCESCSTAFAPGCGLKVQRQGPRNTRPPARAQIPRPP